MADEATDDPIDDSDAADDEAPSESSPPRRPVCATTREGEGEGCMHAG